VGITPDIRIITHINYANKCAYLKKDYLVH
jgi:hypothetical protein